MNGEKEEFLQPEGAVSVGIHCTAVEFKTLFFFKAEIGRRLLRKGVQSYGRRQENGSVSKIYRHY